MSKTNKSKAEKTQLPDFADLKMAFDLINTQVTKKYPTEEEFKKAPAAEIGSYIFSRETHTILNKFNSILEKLINADDSAKKLNADTDKKLKSFDLKFSRDIKTDAVV